MTEKEIPIIYACPKCSDFDVQDVTIYNKHFDVFFYHCSDCGTISLQGVLPERLVSWDLDSKHYYNMNQSVQQLYK